MIAIHLYVFHLVECVSTRYYTGCFTQCQVVLLLGTATSWDLMLEHSEGNGDLTSVGGVGIVLIDGTEFYSMEHGLKAWQARP
jgi:hypothetical protein